MRSRASQARALFRIVSAQSSSSSSSTAATAASSAASATAAAKSTRSAAAAKRRRNAEASPSTKLTNKSNGKVETIFIRTTPKEGSTSSAGQHLIAGLDAVNPPLSSLASVATQAFYALDRPLLEHQVVSSSSKGSGSSSQDANEEEEKTMNSLQSTLLDTKDAIMEAASMASRLTADQLSKTVFVISGPLSEGVEGEKMVWPKKLAALDHSRFVKLVDILSKPGSGKKAVQAEAQALEEEETNRKDVESAIYNALERGEDPKVAMSLGSEADLVVLGEPDGPNPEWPRGVATYLAEKTRALEAPEAPSKEGEQELARGMEIMGIEDLARHFAGSSSAFTMQNMSEDDPALMLNHAIVQAILPDRLKWDGVVAKMDDATTVNGGSSSKIVDLSTLNAGLLSKTEAKEEKVDDSNDVHLDSVKRKRKKKMRKHKYRKFRKATRVERNRLKK